jgi:hypothetical protein
VAVVTWTPRRGDLGAHYASDLIPVVEATNCSRGCVHAGTRREQEEFGPGGNCTMLAALSLGDGTPIEALTLVEDGTDGGTRIDCSARVDPNTVGMAPLFPLPGGGVVADLAEVNDSPERTEAP